jgi:hypothetical protein
MMARDLIPATLLRVESQLKLHSHETLDTASKFSEALRNLGEF